jgi:DNA-3-methyladenine glycosylase
VEVARDLIGTTLLVEIPGGGPSGNAGGIVVETEAYDAEDPASHSFTGRTARNASMFGPAAHAYVYRSYGIHWCLNLVCGTTRQTGPGLGSAVLVRALRPTIGLDRMRERRCVTDERQLCRGPGRLCQALGVTGALDGLPLDQPPFFIGERTISPEIAAGPRIGITRATDTPWRFGLSGSAFLSRPFRTAR